VFLNDASQIGGLVIACLTVVAGLYGALRLVLKINTWTNLVSRAMVENTRATNELSHHVDAISRQLDRYDRKIEGNQNRIERLEREREFRNHFNRGDPN